MDDVISAKHITIWLFSTTWSNLTSGTCTIALSNLSCKWLHPYHDSCICRPDFRKRV